MSAQKPAKKRQKAERKYTYYSVQDRMQWFEWWMANEQNMLAASEHFKVCRATLDAERKRSKWDEKVDRFLELSYDRMIKKLAADNAKQLEFYLNLRKNEIEAFSKLPMKGATGDFDRIMQLSDRIDKLLADSQPPLPTPGASSPEMQVNNISLIVQAVYDKKQAEGKEAPANGTGHTSRLDADFNRVVTIPDSR